MVVCPNCNAQLVDGVKFCPTCGTSLASGSAPQAQPTIIINNTNTNTNTNANVNTTGYPVTMRMRNKWVAIALCLLLGFFGAHKFYEGKIGMGILYVFTGGLFFIGVIIDLIALLTKPNPYYV